jgi:hypothetical protein
MLEPGLVESVRDRIRECLRQREQRLRRQLLRADLD